MRGPLDARVTALVNSSNILPPEWERGRGQGDRSGMDGVGRHHTKVKLVQPSVGREGRGEGKKGTKENGGEDNQVQLKATASQPHIDASTLGTVVLANSENYQFHLAPVSSSKVPDPLTESVAKPCPVPLYQGWVSQGCECRQQLTPLAYHLPKRVHHLCKAHNTLAHKKA